ncbi:hypothetical protein RRG08_005173 [Elysia crispata]|uniref:Uncharacterized protein n=1 Tax=Elysia crispata TaxID=231223 RepID=A0AAE0ZI83_9GAST|nr:hypothetical protein RRG08_005173 [Elysia crispata]
MPSGLVCRSQYRPFCLKSLSGPNSPHLGGESHTIASAPARHDKSFDCVFEAGTWGEPDGEGCDNVLVSSLSHGLSATSLTDSRRPAVPLVCPILKSTEIDSIQSYRKVVPSTDTTFLPA